MAHISRGLVDKPQDAASKIMSRMSHGTNQVDRIFSRQAFSREAARSLELRGELTESDLEVLLQHLARDKQAVTYSSEVRTGGLTSISPLIRLSGRQIQEPQRAFSTYLCGG